MKWLGVIFGISIVSAIGASAFETILANTKSQAEISKETLTTALQASFGTSTCCNVLWAGDTLAIENVFNEFVRIYPHGYTLNNRTYDCQNYFLVTTSVDDVVDLTKKVPTNIASVRLLIVLISDNVEEASDLFNVSMYQNAEVNIAMHNGSWTLSENFLNPRVFKEVSGFHEMSHKKKFVNFRGRELQATTVHHPPYTYLSSAVNRTYNGSAGKFYNIDDEAELDGIEVQFFMLMARRLNFTWTIREGDKIDKYGRRNGSAWSGGAPGRVYQKEVDIAFVAMYITMDRYETVNMTEFWTQVNTKFAVPKPKPHRSFFALVTPLSKEVWAAVLTTLIIQTFYVFIRAWIDERISRRFRNFLVTLTELMGQLLGMWMPARMQGLRVQLHLWHVGGILLVTAYSSNLAARLARELYENKIDTLRDLADSNIIWGGQDRVNLDTFFNASDPIANEIRGRFEFETSPVETHKKILKGNYAIMGAIVNAFFLPRSQISDGDFRGYRIMDEALNTQYMGFVVQPWLVNPLNKVIVQLRETGILQYHFEGVVQRFIGSTQRDLTVEKDDNEGPKVLVLTALGVGFCILILGLTISTIVFFLELKYFNKELSPRQVLEQIKKNREAWRIKELRRKRGYPFFRRFEKAEIPPRPSVDDA